MDMVFWPQNLLGEHAHAALPFTLSDGTVGGLLTQDINPVPIEGYSQTNIVGIVQAIPVRRAERPPERFTRPGTYSPYDRAQLPPVAPPVRERAVLVLTDVVQALNIPVDERFETANNYRVVATTELPENAAVGRTRDWRDRNGRLYTVQFLGAENENAVQIIDRLVALRPEWKEVAELATQRRRVASRDSFIQEASAIFAQQTSELAREERHLMDHLQNLQRTMAEAYRNLDRVRRQKAAMDAGQTDTRAIAEREFDTLLEVDQIVEAYAENNGRHAEIVVKTSRITCEHPDTNQTHDIGDFLIRINCSQGSLHFTNLTRTVGEADHPHVRNHSACLGNMGEMLPTLFASREVAVIAQLAIRFLESVNPNDPWGAQISQWPLVGSAEAATAVGELRDREDEPEEDEEEGDDH